VARGARLGFSLSDFKAASPDRPRARL
jgi:hypothetical protein